MHRLSRERFPSAHHAARFPPGLRSGCAGIYYLSRYGHDLENWAIFEPFPIRPGESRAISPDDENFLKALDILGLKLSTT